MNDRKTVIGRAIEETWDILEETQYLFEGHLLAKDKRITDTENEDSIQGRPDFSALLHSLLPPEQPEPDPDPLPQPEPDPDPLPAYAASCRNLAEIAWTVGVCTRCRLSEERTNAVPGAGVMHPKVMIIGEAPGAQEDRTGEPFVGRAGQYLDKWMAAVKLFRGRDLFIANIIKCRPPGNRDPYPDEQQACIPYLKQQIRILKPRAILCVGRISAQILTGRTEGIGRLRGTQYTYEGIPMIVTYHPSGVLRNPEYRAPVWEDLKMLARLLD